LWNKEPENKDGFLYCPDGTKRIADATLVALTLMLAVSHPDEMSTMVNLVEGVNYFLI
jgi:hypothetical protein